MVRISTIGVVLAVLVAAAVASVTSNDASARQSGGSISLVAYSTPRDAYSQLIPAFQHTPAGQGTSFQQSYGASGEQARAVIAGLKADVVEFSLEPDMTSLVKAGLVAKSWKKETFHGIVTRSVVVFVVRKGNPKHIRTWNDLIKPGVDVLVPNVQTSGGAKWDVIAAYGAQRKLGKSHAQAVKYLSKLYDHVVSQDKSAREALQTFLAGRGDVLLSYENEAIFAQKHDQPIDFVMPKSTIQIANPIAVVKNEHQQDRRPRLRELPPHEARPGAVRPERLSAGCPQRCQGVQLPLSAGCVLDPVARRLAEGRQAVLRLAQRHRDEDPAPDGRLS